MSIKREELNLVVQKNFKIPVVSVGGKVPQEAGKIVYDPLVKSFYYSSSESEWVKVSGINLTSGLADTDRGINVQEASSAVPGVLGDGGRIWVKDTTPTTLVFTDDAGTDHSLTGVDAAETLAEILASGNVTGGNDIVLSNGDAITSANSLNMSSTSDIITTAPTQSLSATSGGFFVNSTGGGALALTSENNIYFTSGSDGLWFNAAALVVQATNITTSVTSNGNAGSIRTVVATLASEATATFTLTNSYIALQSQIIITIQDYSGTLGANGFPYVAKVIPANGSAQITLTNLGTNALNGTITLNYLVIRAIVI